jgi:spermidine synthase
VLPALFRAAGTLDSALILGFGAGTVGRQLKELVSPSRIVGLDLDPIHLSIADGFFDCAEGCELVAADAVEWVASSHGETKFDIIIDDIYSEEDGLPQRCAPMDSEWFHQLEGLLSENGILILNLVEPDRVAHLAILNDATLKQRFPWVKLLKMDGYENRIVACSAQAFDQQSFDTQLKDIRRRFPSCSGVGKRYKIETFSNL